MRPPGSFKIPRPHPSLRQQAGLATELSPGFVDDGVAFDVELLACSGAHRRARRIVDSLRHQISEGGAEQSLRIRKVFETPREIYRLELEVPAMNYQRTTLLDRDALEELLETDAVRAALERPRASVCEPELEAKRVQRG